MFYKILLITVFFFTCTHAQQSSLSWKDVLQYGHSVDTTKMSLKLAGFQEDVSSNKKSVGKAFLLSLIIPGAGEYYIGETSYTKLFVGLEILSLGTIFLNDYLYSSLQQDVRAFAYLNADIGKGSKPSSFWGNIGKYDDIYSYNIQRRRERALSDVYDENSASYWSWNSTEKRFTYDKKRLEAAKIKDREIFFITGLLVNHLLSAINAVRLARQYNKNLAHSDFKFNLVIDTKNPVNKYVGFSFTKSF